MLKYGIWQDWDEAQRAIATKEYRQKKVAMVPEAEAATLCAANPQPLASRLGSG
jgi:hypothetical protein